jgi:hypothetical protein
MISTCIVSILRVQALYVIRQNFNKDVTWENPLAAIWSSVECNTGILCSCLPTLRVLFSKWFPNFLGTVRSGAAGSGKESRSRSNNILSGGNQSTDGTRQLTQGSGNSGRNKMSFDALGRGLTGKGQVVQNSYAYSRNDSDSEEHELDNITVQLQDSNQIQVTTVVEQDVEKLSTWHDGGSTRRLTPSREYPLV